jgi:hypothetical protein
VLPYALLNRKPYVTAVFDLKKVAIEQEKQPQVSGFLGRGTYTGDITRYMPYIDLGTQLHAGKLTTRGCGAYRYEMR